MKRLVIFLAGLFAMALLSAQERKMDLSGFLLRDANGKQHEMSVLLKSHKLSLLVFWKLDDGKSCTLLNELYEAATETLQGIDFQLITIAETSASMAQLEQNYVLANAPEAFCLSDVNGDLRRHLAITELPYTLLFDSNSRLICSQRGYCVDASDQLCDKVRSCLIKMDQAIIKP